MAAAMKRRQQKQRQKRNEEKSEDYVYGQKIAAEKMKPLKQQ